MEAAPTPQPDNEPALTGTPVMLAERMEIFPSAPLPALDTPHAKAYAARARGEQRASSFALICHEALPIRGVDLANFLSCDNPALLRFRDQGIVDWPLTNKREQVLVFARPGGKRLDTVYAKPQRPMEDEELVRFFVRPMYNLLRDLLGKSATHGNIHLGNLFMSGSGASSEAQLGDALTTPPSYSLPALYCTIERAQCHIAGRGVATIADDIYAVGICALIMALGTNPWESLSTEDIIKLKLEKGSFFGLVGEQRLKGSVVELFRGMLDDNPRRRWTLNDLETWLGGRRPTPRQNEDDNKGVRGFTFDGMVYTTIRSVAHALTRNPILGATAIENNEIEKWMQHSLSDEKLALTLRRAIAGLTLSRAANAHDMIVARAAIVMDPNGPVRFRELALMPSGATYLLGTLMVKGGNTQTLAEILASNLCQQWADAQEEGRADHLQILQQLENAQAMLQRRGLGFGMERVLYEMLPAQPCLGNLVRNYACRNIYDLLFSIDQALSRGTGDVADRHIMGFLLAREKRLPSQAVLALGNSDSAIQRTIAVLRVLAEAQHRHGPEKLTNLTNWMMAQLEPATKRFFEKAAQESARAQIQAAGKEGKLAPLVAAVDDGSKVDRDRAEFERARNMYFRATQQIAELQLDIDERDAVEIRVGQPVASGIAAIVGFVAIGLIILMTIMGIRL